jgi:hypothetical protein
MLRMTLIALVSILAVGCGTLTKERVAKIETSQAATELECMSDCLDEGDADCDECAVRCFQPTAGIAITSR